MPKPNLYIGVTGTNTDVGKTYVGSRLLRSLKQKGLSVSARKPAQSYDKGDLQLLDSQVLAAETEEDHLTVCSQSNTFEIALAPFMAKKELYGTELMLKEVSDVIFNSQADVGLLEGAGGVLSPFCKDADFIDLMELQKVDIVLCIADATLGSLNAILTNYFGFKYQIEKRNYVNLKKAGFIVFLNRFDEDLRLHQLNYDWLKSNFEQAVYKDIEELSGYLADLSNKNKSY